MMNCTRFACLFWLFQDFINLIYSGSWYREQRAQWDCAAAGVVFIHEILLPYLCAYKVLEVAFTRTHKDILKHINHKTEMYTENMCKYIKWPPSLPKNTSSGGKRMPVSRRHTSNPSETVAPADENRYF